MNAQIKLGVLFSVLFICVSCRDNADDPPFSIIPEIKLKSFTQDTILEFEDILTLNIRYQDGDGDLGCEEPDSYAVFIRDARLTKYDGFYLAPVAPPGALIAVQGDLKVEFPDLFVFGNRSEERTKFYIYMVDRKGNKSNELITPEVIIKKKG
ncbi:MAG: hypothetical protein IPL25_19455 [Saprospiraceae bacterium]|nr:hypothetical protein [Candidatus Vicinibacter affinis]